MRDWQAWEPGIRAVLVFVVCDGKILLIEKKRGIGAGKINGPGGKIDPGETPYQAALRECHEELGINVLDAQKFGELWFGMSDLPDIHCHVFRASMIEGEPIETSEAVPRWTRLEEIPFEQMWEDDQHWLPQLINGQYFNARFVFEGEKILWQEVLFGMDSCRHWTEKSTLELN